MVGIAIIFFKLSTDTYIKYINSHNILFKSYYLYQQILRTSLFIFWRMNETFSPFIET